MFNKEFEQENQEQQTNDRIVELENTIIELKNQLNSIKADNSTLFKAINENLEKVVSNTQKSPIIEQKPKRF